MIEIRPSESRGVADHGWLQARHSFSFANYHDPQRMGVSALRVINDDVFAPGGGFPTHPHSDMATNTYIKGGAIAHRDSMGHTQQIGAGEVQRMSAGSGITHSEFNASDREPLELLQIWIEPNELGIEPEYEQRTLEQKRGLLLIASADGREDSMRMHQDASLYRLNLEAEDSLDYPLDQQRTAYLQLVGGEVVANGETLGVGDGAVITDEPQIHFAATTGVELLLFDLP